MTDKAGYPQAAFGGDRFGKRRVPKMYAEVNRLRDAIRAHDADATEAAWDAVEQHIDFAYQNNAAPAPAQAWRVKPLEWREGTRSFVSFFAEAIGLEYEVHVIPDLPVQWTEASMPEWHEASDIETAKAAAQADYASRILAAMEPTNMQNPHIASQTWRDISTAPKDGTLILAYRPQAAETGDPVIDVVRTQKYPRRSFQGVEHYTDRACHPTHWLPLPEPPAALIPDTEAKP